MKQLDLKAKHWIEERLVILNNLKDIDFLLSKQKEWKLKNKVKRIKTRNKKKSDFKTDLAFTVKSTKDSELLSGTPEYTFIPLDKDSRSLVRILKEIWKYWWLVSKTDKAIAKTIQSATAYGTGIVYEALKTIKKKVKIPYYKEGKLDYKEEERIEYDGVYIENIPWENFYIDGTDIDESNEAIWIKYRDRETLLQEVELNPNYKNLSLVPKSKEYSIVTAVNDPRGGLNDDEIITEIKYYNLSRDEYIILFNGIEVYNSPIPFTHKELPFAVFFDYQVDGRFWGMGEYELLEEDDEFKNALRSLSIDVIKAQMGVTFINESIDLDTSTVEFGPSKYVTVDDINGIKFYSPSISTNSIDRAEEKLDNDVIAKTGVDHRVQQFNSGETAKKTGAKGEAQKKQINKNLKLNGFSFFERLARLRLANLKLFHSSGIKEIFVEGGNISQDGVYEPINGGYGSFTITPDFLKGDYNIIPITESILGLSEERDKINYLSFFEATVNTVDKGGQPIISPEKKVKILSDKFGIDFEELTEKAEVKQNPEDIVKSVLNDNKGISNDTQDPNNPNFIPPNQRSGATTRMASQPNLIE